MGGVATINEYTDSHYLLSQVVRSVEDFEGRHPLWVEHDPQGGCMLRLHLSDMKRHITGNPRCGPILNDPRCAWLALRAVLALAAATNRLGCQPRVR